MKQDGFQYYCFGIEGVTFCQMLGLFIDSPSVIICVFIDAKSSSLVDKFELKLRPVGTDRPVAKVLINCIK